MTATARPGRRDGTENSEDLEGREQRESRRLRRPTSTAAFGSSRRESHDASAFYGRFVAPEVSADATVVRPSRLDVVYTADGRAMGAVEANSVALVVTSPPYFAGKEYEQSLGQDGVPATYFDYLALLREVFAECKRVLEPGGRLAVNVANLGRRPYRSLAGDVAQVLQDLGLLLRGEVVWWKGRAAGGSCAWGTFQRPSNPVLRDVTERIVIASKGRFDRALKPHERLARGLPSTATISRDEFLEATTDLWEIPPESATRVGHPAPFPVDLPKRLIELYTYEDDVVLDPFLGSGSTAVAAVRTGRRFIGFESDPAYAGRAQERIAAEQELRCMQPGPSSPVPFRVRLPARESITTKGTTTRDATTASEEVAVLAGLQAKELAGILLSESGFGDIRPDVKLPRLGIDLAFLARDAAGREWAFDLSGAFTSGRVGLRRADALWRALGKASVMQAERPDTPLVLLTTEAPAAGSAGSAALQAVMGPGRPVYDVIELLHAGDRERLRRYGRGDHVRPAQTAATAGHPDQVQTD